MKLAEIKLLASRTTGRSMLYVKKYSPEILLATGVIGLIAGTVMVCKANTKAEAVVDKAKTTLETIQRASQTLPASEYSKQDRINDLTIVYVKTGFEFVKLYGPGITLGLSSIACILGSHNIMKKRNLALVAAYKTIEQGFSEYRKRVISELGDEKDFEFKHGIKKEKVTEEVIDADTGKVVKKKKEVSVVNSTAVHSPYSRFFDETNVKWTGDPELDKYFLMSQENFINQRLRVRGHIFLNEVYEALGFEHTREGAVVGWVLDSKGRGDGRISFGIFDINYRSNREFVNGLEKAVLLDFNVDGVILDELA